MPAVSLRRLRVLALATLAASVLLAAPAAAPADAATCKRADAGVNSVSSYRLGQATLCLVNRARVHRGLRKLKANRRLSRAALRHSRDMARNNYFSHVSRNGASFLTRIKRTGYLRGARSWSAGENIAWGSGSRGTPRSIVRAWMRSSGHRRNILGRFRHLGLGVVKDTPAAGHHGATYTHAFGRR